MVSTLPKPRPACDSRRDKFVLYGICTDALRESPFVHASNCIGGMGDFRSDHKMPIFQNMLWWARQGLNLRPHPCEGRVRFALPPCYRKLLSRFRNDAVRGLYISYKNRGGGRRLHRPFSRLSSSRSTASRMKSERFSLSASTASMRAIVPARKRPGVCSSLIFGRPTPWRVSDITFSAKPCILLISPIDREADITYLGDIRYGDKP